MGTAWQRRQDRTGCGTGETVAWLNNKKYYLVGYWVVHPPKGLLYFMGHERASGMGRFLLAGFTVSHPSLVTPAGWLGLWKSACWVTHKESDVLYVTSPAAPSPCRSFNFVQSLEAWFVNDISQLLPVSHSAGICTPFTHCCYCVHLFPLFIFPVHQSLSARLLPQFTEPVKRLFLLVWLPVRFDPCLFPDHRFLPACFPTSLSRFDPDSSFDCPVHRPLPVTGLRTCFCPFCTVASLLDLLVYELCLDFDYETHYSLLYCASLIDFLYHKLLPVILTTSVLIPKINLRFHYNFSFCLHFGPKLSSSSQNQEQKCLCPKHHGPHCIT